jgi:hypothetical protein
VSCSHIDRHSLQSAYASAFTQSLSHSTRESLPHTTIIPNIDSYTILELSEAERARQEEDTGSAMSSSVLKRNTSSRRDRDSTQTGVTNGNGSHSSSAEDESAPIMRHRQGAGKDYQAISPSIPARTGAGSEGISSAREEQPLQHPAREPQQQRQHDRSETEGAGRAAEDAEREEGSAWRKMLEKYGSVELENKGSVARDHLALGMSGVRLLSVQILLSFLALDIVQLHVNCC